MALLSLLQETPRDVRCGNKATTSIGPHATAFSDEGMCNFTACFPNLGVP
jgi:hypothetical protein